MERPKSIVMFERCYLAGFVAGVASITFLWPELKAGVAAQGAFLGIWLLPAIGVVIPLLLLYLIALRGERAQEMDRDDLARPGVVRLAQQFAANRFIFRPDTRTWFGENRSGSA